MRTLYLLRHAKSSWDDPNLLDHDRPLAARGRRDARRMTEQVRRAEPAPELVLCSSAARATETLARIRGALGDAVVEVEDELYAASADELLRRLRAVPDGVRSVLVIGHNPGLHELALLLAGSGAELDRLRVKFPTAALATLAIPCAAWNELRAGGAELTGYVVPKEV